MEDACEFIGHDSQGAAHRFANGVIQAVERLTVHPLSGRMVPGFAPRDFREIIFPPYRIIYRYDAGEGLVLVLFFWHSSRLLNADSEADL